MRKLGYAAFFIAFAFCLTSSAWALMSPPTAVTETSAMSDTTPTFTWSAPSDLSGSSVASYEVYFDGDSFVNIGNNTNYTSPNVLAQGNHVFYVRAKDANGNAGATAVLSFAVDSVSPTVGAVSPSAATANASTTYTASYSDTQGVANCHLWIDGADKGAMTLSSDTKSGTATMSATIANTGNSNAQVKCTDVAGNVGTSAVTTVAVSGTVDIVAPTMPLNLQRVSEDTDGTPTFAWNASSDAKGVTEYQVSVDGSSFVTVGTALSYTSGFLTTGAHTFKVRALDAAGNVSQVATLNFSVNASSTTSPAPAPSPVNPGGMIVFSLERMKQDADLIAAGTFASLQGEVGMTGCEMSEAAGKARVAVVFANQANESEQARIAAFASCGTASTLHLGAGERMGVVASFRAAYGHFPRTAAEWNDVVKIANGRFPATISVSAEASAKARFQTVYRRAANMAVEHDKAAVTVMAYGLRPNPRNLNAEAEAIASFRAIFHRAPSSANDWDTVRAIAYSGATR